MSMKHVRLLPVVIVLRAVLAVVAAVVSAARVPAVVVAAVVATAVLVVVAAAVVAAATVAEATKPVQAVQIASFASASECLLTWNARHFVGKLVVPVFTPQQWLDQQASPTS